MTTFIKIGQEFGDKQIVKLVGKELLETDDGWKANLSELELIEMSDGDHYTPKEFRDEFVQSRD